MLSYLFQHIIYGLFLRRQIQISVHQMTRIQHNSLYGIMNLCQKAFCYFRTCHGKPGPPEIFHKKFKFKGLPVQELINKLCRRVHDFLICMKDAVGKKFRIFHITHMKYHIGNMKAPGQFQIRLQRLQNLFPSQASVDLPDLIHRPVFPHEVFHISLPQIDPVVPIPQMQSSDIFPLEKRRLSAWKMHQFQGVQVLLL